MKRISAVRLLEELEAAVERYGLVESSTVSHLIDEVSIDVVNQARGRANRKTVPPQDEMLALDPQDE